MNKIIRIDLCDGDCGNGRFGCCDAEYCDYGVNFGPDERMADALIMASIKY